MTTSALIQSINVDALVMRRNDVVRRITEAHTLCLEACRILETVNAPGSRMLALECMYSRSARFTDPDDLPYFIRMVDARFWDHLLVESGMKTFMDAAARREWEEGLNKGTVPELTADTIRATFETLYSNRAEMFDRGVIKVFQDLSWDYASNNPRKFGRRLVRRYGLWTSQGEIMGLNHAAANALDDLVRAMMVLDGKAEPDSRGGSYQELARQNWPRQAQTAELHGMLSLRGFKNGNIHITFLRPDLVDKLNAILAKHHPRALPPAQE